MSPQAPRSGDGGPRRGGDGSSGGPRRSGGGSSSRGSAPQRRSGSPAVRWSAAVRRAAAGQQRHHQAEPADPASRAPGAGAGPPVDVHDPDGVRLQKLLAAAGVGSAAASARTSSPPAGSRSTARSSPSSACGSTPTARSCTSTASGSSSTSRRVYLAFNKPLGVVSTMNDDLGRPSRRRLRAEPQRAPLPRRSPRRRHRGPAAADQRRRPRPPAAAPVVRRRQDLPGADPRPGAARHRQDAARRHRARGRAGQGRLVQGRRLRSRARPWSRSCCTRDASTSYGACSRRSGTR